MTDTFTIASLGYGRWQAGVRWRQMLATLGGHGIRCVVDVRHSACASTLDPANAYGPRDWHLQAEGGIEVLLNEHGIDYLWLVELGNPQKRDHGMTVFRKHLADRQANRPATRGLNLLEAMVRRDSGIAIMCACADYETCHRALIVDALSARLLPSTLAHRDLTATPKRSA